MSSANSRRNWPQEWIAWVVAIVGWVSAIFVWVSGGPEERTVSTVAAVLVAIAAAVIAWIAIVRRSTAIGVLALVTLLSPLLLLVASFAAW